ncbi:diaminopimelate decarboxylase [candidate division KSB1 bacterium]
MYNMKYINGELYWDGISIDKLANKYGTPLYIYNKNVLTENFSRIKNSFSSLDPVICFALKSNSNISLLKIIAGLGAGADTVSGGELFLALRCGFKSEKIVFSGVGKTDDEIEFALKNKILMINVESEEELYNVNNIAKKINAQAPVAIRINPDIDANTHPYISTGMKKNKFGIDLEKCHRIYKKAQNMGNIDTKGIHMHIGSQITDIEPYLNAVESLYDLYTKLLENGINPEYINIGGGFGHGYEDIYKTISKGKDFEEKEPDLFKLGEKIRNLFEKKVRLILEPGRRITASAGILAGKVLYRKQKSDKVFLLTDTGMTELIRPSLYRAFHGVLPVKQNNKKIKGDLVGPICESTDFIAQDRELPDMQQGDYFAVLSSGAYGFALSSNYNSRLKPAEVLIDNARTTVIRERESTNILLNNQPETLNWT